MIIDLTLTSVVFESRWHVDDICGRLYLTLTSVVFELQCNQRYYEADTI